MSASYGRQLERTDQPVIFVPQDTTVVYGGSFNPPHMSHQMTCLYLLEALGASEVWLVPSFCHALGKKLIAFETRLAMCELLAAPFGSRVQVSTVERDLGGVSRTYDTLKHLLKINPERHFALAVGADIIAETHRWYRWEDVTKMVHVIIVGRSGYTHTGCQLELPRLASQGLRESLLRGDSIAGLVPASVAAYIEKNQLYRTR